MVYTGSPKPVTLSRRLCIHGAVDLATRQRAVETNHHHLLRALCGSTKAHLTEAANTETASLLATHRAR